MGNNNPDGLGAFITHVMSVLDDAKTLISQIIGLLGLCAYGYHILRKFLARDKAMNYKETLRRIERVYGRIDAATYNLKRKTELGTINEDDLKKLRTYAIQIGKLIDELPVDLKDPPKVGFADIPHSDFETANKEGAVRVILNELLDQTGRISRRTVREIRYSEDRYFIEPKF